MKNDSQGLRGLKTFSYKHSQSRTRTNPLTKVLREAGRFMRATSCIAGIALLNAIFFPYYTVAQEATEVAAAQREAAERIVLKGSSEERLNQALLKVQELAHSKCDTISGRLSEKKSMFSKALNSIGLAKPQLEEVGQLEQLCDLLEGLDKTAMAQFKQTEDQLRAKGMPEEILQRHLDMVAHYKEQFAELSTCLTEVMQADDLEDQGAAMDALDQLMAPQKLKKRHQKVDPNNLPWGTPDASKVREPAQTPEELSKHTGISPYPQGILLAANTLPANIFDLLGGPVAEDLGETPDIQITDAIRDLAENQLGDDPVAIYNWVRNNIEFIPSYGSIQGADYTLQHGRGNAFDTASLLIALYRASNIPARYAYGTVRIPVDEVMNWVGGVEVPEAAQQLLGQGGIPNLGLAQGGVITHIEMEHVWVEAWVDYFPSRAAKHNVGDQWIPLDPSFKQYEFTEGEDLETNVPFDAQGLVDQITATATIDETAGFVQGVDQAAVEAALADYQQQIEDYINAQDPDATVGDVLGTQKVIVQEYQQLAAGLPYELVVRTNNYSELPDNLRHKFRYTLGTEYFGQESSRLITFEQSLPELAGKKHALSFRPATQADEDLINSYLPEPDPATGEIDPSQLPNTLPGYLISLVAEFTQDGDVIESATAGKMGGELYETLALWSPSEGWQQAVNYPTAGECRAIGLDLQGINPREIVRLQEKLEEIKLILESSNDSLINNLGKHELVGSFLNTTISSYFGLNNLQEKAQTALSNVVAYRLPSYGVFSTTLRSDYWFGLPRNVTASSLSLDVDRIAIQAVDKNGFTESKVRFVRAAGIRASAMEHHIPELIFSIDGSPARAISTVKALAIANQEGQKIWTITQSNLNLALNSLNLDIDVEEEIRNSVLAGNEVTAHENPVSFSGSAVTGYILTDTDTGSGAYKISGGANGGEAFLGVSLGLLQAFAFFLIATPALAVVAGVAGLIISLIVSLSGSFDLTQQLDFNGGRLLGYVGGFILTWILGGYVFVATPLLFWIGLVALIFSVFKLMITLILSTLAFNFQSTSKIRFVRIEKKKRLKVS